MAGRKREIVPAESSVWLGVLLDAVFDPTSKVLNLAARAEAMNRGAQSSGWSARIGRSELLSIARDVTDYPDDYPPSRASELLLLWANRWLTAEDWARLKARVRKRRQRING